MLLNIVHTQMRCRVSLSHCAFVSALVSGVRPINGKEILLDESHPGRRIQPRRLLGDACGGVCVCVCGVSVQ